MTNTPTEFEWEDTAADIQRRRDEREHREREEAHKQHRQEREREEARRVETPQEKTSQMEEAVAEKRPRTDRSKSEMDTGWRRGQPIQEHERTYDNIYLTEISSHRE